MTKITTLIWLLTDAKKPKKREQILKTDHQNNSNSLKCKNQETANKAPAIAVRLLINKNISIAKILEATNLKAKIMQQKYNHHPPKNIEGLLAPKDRQIWIKIWIEFWDKKIFKTISLSQKPIHERIVKNWTISIVP